MNIGNKIKTLRKQHGITQEQLAENIGISFQAVSKWENNIALPDITLAPALASYFGISMDELFDFNLEKIEIEIKEIANNAYKFREGDPTKSRQILEEGLKKYPENDNLLCNLLYVLNYSANPDETIIVANKIIEKTTHSDIKYDALRFLAYAYKAKNDLKSVEAAIQQIPEIYFTKLTEMAFLLSGKTKFEAAQKQKWISFENLLQMMCKTAEYYEEIGEIDNATKELKKATLLIPILENSAYDNYLKFFNDKIKQLQTNADGQ